MELEATRQRRPISCYVTPPLDSATNFIRPDDTYTPKSDTFSYTGSPSASPVSSVSDHVMVNTPRVSAQTSPKVKPGFFRRLSNKFKSGEKSRTSTNPSPSEPLKERLAPSPKGPASPEMKTLGRSFSLRSRKSKSSSTLGLDSPKSHTVTLQRLTTQSPQASPRAPINLQDPPVILRKQTVNLVHRHSIHGATFYSGTTTTEPPLPFNSEMPLKLQSQNHLLSSHILDPVTDDEEPTTPTRTTTRRPTLEHRNISDNTTYSSLQRRLTRKSSVSSRAIETITARKSSVFSIPSYVLSSSTLTDGLGISTSSTLALIEPTGTSPVKPSILKLKIYIEETESHQNEDVEFIAIKLRKDKLKNLNELINLIMFKIMRTRPDVSLNNVKLLIIFKDQTLNPIVLKPSLYEVNKELKVRRPIQLNNDDLLLDYIMIKDKLYIKAQLKV